METGRGACAVALSLSDMARDREKSAAPKLSGELSACRGAACSSDLGRPYFLSFFDRRIRIMIDRVHCFVALSDLPPFALLTPLQLRDRRFERHGG